MPLITSKSPIAFSKNVETEIKAGKPKNQAFAIAYAKKNEAKDEQIPSEVQKEYDRSSKVAHEADKLFAEEMRARHSGDWGLEQKFHDKIKPLQSELEESQRRLHRLGYTVTSYGELHKVVKDSLPLPIEITEPVHLPASDRRGKDEDVDAVLRSWKDIKTGDIGSMNRLINDPQAPPFAKKDAESQLRRMARNHSKWAKDSLPLPVEVDDEFSEKDHPRAKNGEFGKGGSGKKGTPKSPSWQPGTHNKEKLDKLHNELTGMGYKLAGSSSPYSPGNKGVIEHHYEAKGTPGVTLYENVNGKHSTKVSAKDSLPIEVKRQKLAAHNAGLTVAQDLDHPNALNSKAEQMIPGTKVHNAYGEVGKVIRVSGSRVEVNTPDGPDQWDLAKTWITERAFDVQPVKVTGVKDYSRSDEDAYFKRRKEIQSELERKNPHDDTNKLRAHEQTLRERGEKVTPYRVAEDTAEGPYDVGYHLKGNSYESRDVVITANSWDDAMRKAKAGIQTGEELYRVSPRDKHAAWAKDSSPSETLTEARKAEVAQDHARALDAYRAAAHGFRQVGDSLNEQVARDGIAACQRQAAGGHSDEYAHPSHGKVQAFDSAERALESAVERTRSGEDVALEEEGTVVAPCEDADPVKVRTEDGEFGVSTNRVVRETKVPFHEAEAALEAAGWGRWTSAFQPKNAVERAIEFLKTRAKDSLPRPGKAKTKDNLPRPVKVTRDAR